MWYLNEDNEPYEFSEGIEEQTAAYPNDCHTPFETEKDALEGRKYAVYDNSSYYVFQKSD